MKTVSNRNNQIILGLNKWALIVTLLKSIVLILFFLASIQVAANQVFQTKTHFGDFGFKTTNNDVASGTVIVNQNYEEMFYAGESLNDPRNIDVNRIIPARKLTAGQNEPEILTRIARYSIENWIKEMESEKSASPVVSVYNTLQNPLGYKKGSHKFQVKSKVTEPTMQMGVWGRNTFFASMDAVTGEIGFHIGKKVGEKVVSVVTKTHKKDVSTYASISWGF